MYLSPRFRNHQHPPGLIPLSPHPFVFLKSLKRISAMISFHLPSLLYALLTGKNFPDACDLPYVFITPHPPVKVTKW